MRFFTLAYTLALDPDDRDGPSIAFAACLASALALCSMRSLVRAASRSQPATSDKLLFLESRGNLD